MTEKHEWALCGLCFLAGLCLGLGVIAVNFLFPSESSPSELPKSEPRLSRNIEEWDVIRDSEGNIIKVTVHREKKVF